jgi:ankyrin repeat protein/predicted aspartyl protease
MFSMTLVLGLSSQSLAQPRIEYPPGQTEVKIHLLRAGDHLLVPVRIDGRDAGLFVLDTGASSVFVNTALAEQLKLPPIGEKAALNSASSVDAQLLPIDDLELGGVRVRQTIARGTDLTRLGEGLGMKQLNGVIGGQFLFSHMAFSVNWSEATLTLYQAASEPRAGSTRMPVRFFRGIPAITMRFENGTSGWLLVDTGDNGDLTFTSQFSRANWRWLQGIVFRPETHIQIDGPHLARMVQLPSVELGDVTLPGCDLTYSMVREIPYALEGEDGRIGLGILRHLDITFDYRAGVVWIRRDPHDGVPAEWDQKDFDVNSTDRSGVTPLMRAAEMKRRDDVERFLAAGARPDATDARGASALSYATAAGDLGLIRRLLTAGAPADVVSHLGFTPLHAAASMGVAEAVKLFLERGAKVGATDLFGRTPLINAAENGDPKTVALLIKAGSELNLVSPGSGSALNAAAVNGRFEAAKLLLDAGADAKATDRDRTPLLFQAAFGGSVSLVNLLLERGSDPNAITTRSQTPLFAALFGGHPEIVKILLDHGADPRIRDTDKKMAIEHANSDEGELARLLYFYRPPNTRASDVKAEGRN